MALSTQDKLLVETRIANEQKSLAVAYLLWFFLCLFGAHRFYLGKSASAMCMLVLSLTGIVLSIVGIGLIILIIPGIWAIVDLFLLPGIAREQQENLRQKLTLEATSAQ